MVCQLARSAQHGCSAQAHESARLQAVTMLPARELIQLAQSAAVPAFPRVKVAAGCTAWMGALHTSQRGALVWWYWLLVGWSIVSALRRSRWLQCTKRPRGAENFASETIQTLTFLASMATARGWREWLPGNSMAAERLAGGS